MTRDKAQKRATRARMGKTGERYTAARRHVVKPPEELRAEDLGHTDAAIRQNTGKGWREWLSILDGWGARERKHGDTVARLMKEHGVPGWWAQAVTVGYERARGMRAKYQRATGFTVSVSKTFDVGWGRHALCRVHQRPPPQQVARARDIEGQEHTEEQDRALRLRGWKFEGRRVFRCKGTRQDDADRRA